jgi:prephenate dehydratase
MPRVAFQGELGAFSEQGVLQLWPSGAEPVPMREFIDVARAVERGDVDLGLLPIENTLAGSVIGSYDALFACDGLHVVAETVVAIHHCVLALSGATLESLRTVSSHPVALAQCGRFFRAHPQLVARAAYDTAGAAREVAERGDPTAAAIAGRAAAERYGLQVVAADVEDRPDNQTRFLALARTPVMPARGTPARTSLLLTTANAPGSLVRALEPIAAHGINMSKLESRPTGEPWSYRFFVEIEHEALDAEADAAIAEIRAVTQSLRVLGSYPRWLASGRPETVGAPPETLETALPMNLDGGMVS